jgi:hypothetical protein
MGKIIADGMATHSVQLAEHVTVYNSIAQEQWLGMVRRGIDPATMLVGRVVRESLVMSFEDGFRTTMLAIGLGIVMVMLIKRPTPGQGAGAGAH